MEETHLSCGSHFRPINGVKQYPQRGMRAKPTHIVVNPYTVLIYPPRAPLLRMGLMADCIPRAEKNRLFDIPGQYIVAALDALPVCGPGSRLQSVDIDAGHWGRYHVYFKPYKKPNGPYNVGSPWFWIAVSAEILDLGQ